MRNIRIILCLIAIALALPVEGLAKVFLTVKNPGQRQRMEVVAFNIHDIWAALEKQEGTPLIVRNAYRQQIPSQATTDGHLLIEASVQPQGTATFTVEAGKPMTYECFANGQLYKKRVDDFTWENDKCAYRAYGPALQKTGEQAFGFDVWLKSTPYLDVEKRYARVFQGTIDVNALRKQGHRQEADSTVLATSLHLEHGTGLDCYNVGPSLGCGTPAVLLGDSLVMPWCYESFKVLENGPLRFSAEFIYPTKKIGKETLQEHRLVRLSKGSYFNEITVWFEGLKKKSRIDVCGGLVVHTDRASDLTLANDHIAYTDPTDNLKRHNFEIYVGVLFPDGADETRFVEDTHHVKQGIVGNAVGIKRGLRAGEKLTYWFGAAWNQSGIPDREAWDAQIKRFLSDCKTPLALDIVKK